MKRTEECGGDLTDLPNIGKEAVKLLTAVGITTPNDLRRVGAVTAACRIRKLRPADPPCRSMLTALEGAIRGVRWHAIPRAQREKLWSKYQKIGQGSPCFAKRFAGQAP